MASSVDREVCSEVAGGDGGIGDVPATLSQDYIERFFLNMSRVLQDKDGHLVTYTFVQEGRATLMSGKAQHRLFADEELCKKVVLNLGRIEGSLEFAFKKDSGVQKCFVAISDDLIKSSFKLNGEYSVLRNIRSEIFKIANIPEPSSSLPGGLAVPASTRVGPESSVDISRFLGQVLSVADPFTDNPAEVAPAALPSEGVSAPAALPSEGVLAPAALPSEGVLAPAPDDPVVSFFDEMKRKLANTKYKFDYTPNIGGVGHRMVYTDKKLFEEVMQWLTIFYTSDVIKGGNTTGEDGRPTWFVEIPYDRIKNSLRNAGSRSMFRQMPDLLLKQAQRSSAVASQSVSSVSTALLFVHGDRSSSSDSRFLEPR